LLVFGSFGHLPFNQRGHRLFKCAKEILRYLECSGIQGIKRTEHPGFRQATLLGIYISQPLLNNVSTALTILRCW
ncbi:MAG: hypothetical protein ABW124_19655, partial [Candidatus Thiodiazotropha sp. 6PLUC9]